MKKHLSLIIVLVFFFFQFNSTFAQTSGYKVVNEIKIGGVTDWDYLSISETTSQLFVSHGAEVDVINLDNNSVVGKIEGLQGVHGIAFAPEFEKGFISDGDGNSIVIFDLKTLKKIVTVKSTGEDPDAILYDPFTKLIFAFNGNSTNATAINAKTNDVVGSVDLSGSPEFGVSDFNGKLFVNIEKKNQIDVIDPKTLKVINTWPIPPCEKPSAMAIDRENQKLFIGARNKTFGVVDIETGKVIFTCPIGSGVDACAFDSKTKLIFCSNKDATMSIIKQNSPDSYSFVENIATPPRSKTLALDESTHKIYTSTSVGEDKKFGVMVFGK